MPALVENSQQRRTIFMSKRIYVQEIGDPEDKLVFIEFVGLAHDLVIESVVKQFKDRGFDVMWGANN